MHRNNTPASTYLHNREMVATYMVLNNPVIAMGFVDDMCACITELTREAMTWG